MREPTPPPTIVTNSRLVQTDPWIPSSTNDKSDDINQEFQKMMQTKVEELENKYQRIIEQKNTQIQQLIQEVLNKYFSKIKRIRLISSLG